MRGDSPFRFGASGWLLIASLAVFALFLMSSTATASGGVRTPYGALAAGETVHVAPLSVGGTPREIVPESVTVDYTVSIRDGFQGPAPAGAPVPQPRDAPFGTEVAVTTNANSQTHPSIAGEPSGSVLYIAYTNQTSPTNRDVYVARSTNGGATWTHLGVATSGTYNEFEPRIVVHGSRVFLLFSNDDGANIRGFRYAISTNQGASWTVSTLNYNNAPFRDLRVPDATSFNGQYLYVVYQAHCDVTGSCSATGNDNWIMLTVMFDANGMIVPPTIYFPFIASAGGPPLPTFEGTIQANADITTWFADADGTNITGEGTGLHDILWISTTTGQNTAASWAGAFITGVPSTDRVRVDAAGFQPDFVVAYQIINPPAGLNNHIIASLHSEDSGTMWAIDVLAGAAGREFKDPSIFASNPLFHATFLMGTDVGYTYTLDPVAGFAAPFKVNSNAVGTAVDGIKNADVTYAGGVRVTWTDNRLGNNDVFFSKFSGFAFYIFDRSPRYGTITIDGGAPVAVATAQLWATGDTHTVVTPATDQTGPGTRLVFDRWSDANTNPSRTITVGATDITLVAQYHTEYFLDISATVGTTNPTSSWYMSAASVTISWNAPAPLPRVQYTFSDWVGSGPGSYTGTTNQTTITMNGPITEVANAVRQFQVKVDTNPTGLYVTIDGGPQLFAPQWVWWTDGTTHTIVAVTPQSPGAPTQRYQFDHWDNGPNTPSQTLTATGANDYTAFFNSEYQMTFNTVPSGRFVTIDGTQYVAPYTTWWRSGFSHPVDVQSPQTVGSDTRYLYVSWSDGGAQAHNIGPVSQAQTFTVTFDTQYRYFIATDTPGFLISLDGGANLTAPQTFWWSSGQTHTIRFPTPQTVSADTRRAFFQWNDGITQNPRTFTSGTTATGTWTIQTFLEYRWHFDTVPANVQIPIQVNAQSVTAPGDVWLRDATTATITAPSPSLDPINPTGIRYMFQSWSIGGTNPQSLTVGGPQTITATYRTQFYLGVTSAYATVSGNTWYYSGDTAFAGVDVGIFPASPTDTRYVFVSWTGDASGTVFSQSSAILMNAPKTATATWKTQYKLTIVSSYATTSCSVPSCWYDTGDATATASIDQTNVAAGAGTRHHFTGWSGGASGAGATSNAITMSGPKIATAQWVTQYLVTVTVGQSGVTASCSNADCWYDSGTSNANVALSTNGVSLGAGARTGFIRWSGDASGTDWTRSDPILIDQPKAVTVVWQTQYQLTLTGDDPANGGTSVVTQVGSPGNDGWYVSGDAAQLSLTSPVPGGSGIRWKFTSWGGAASGTSTSTSVIMSGPKSVTLAWQKQFQVTVGTDPANVATVSITPTPDAGGWVNDGATIQVSVGSEVSAAGKTYVFVSWTGASGGATGTATITGPTTLTATFREKGLFESPAVLGGLIAAIVAALLIAILFLWRRKRSSGAEMPPATAGAPPAPAEESTMQCPSCGMTIPAKAGPCPICGTEVAPPAAPAGDERIAKLTEAYQSGRISKEQYQTNLKRIRGNT